MMYKPHRPRDIHNNDMQIRQWADPPKYGGRCGHVQQKYLNVNKSLFSICEL